MFSRFILYLSIFFFQFPIKGFSAYTFYLRNWMCIRRLVMLSYSKFYVGFVSSGSGDGAAVEIAADVLISNENICQHHHHQHQHLKQTATTNCVQYLSKPVDSLSWNVQFNGCQIEWHLHLCRSFSFPSCNRTHSFLRYFIDSCHLNRSNIREWYNSHFELEFDTFTMFQFTINFQ